jgi:hypothetical protein
LKAALYAGEITFIIVCSHFRKVKERREVQWAFHTKDICSQASWGWNRSSLDDRKGER